MSKISELEQQLEQAKEQQEKKTTLENRARLVALIGKTFRGCTNAQQAVRSRAVTKWKNVYFYRILKVSEIDTWGRFEVITRTLGVTVATRAPKKFDLAAHEGADYSIQSRRDPGTECDPQMFDTLWDLTKLRAMSTLEQVIDGLPAVEAERMSVESSPMSDKDILPTLDLPHARLEPYETTYVPSFFLLDDCYLLSPNSRAAAKARLMEEDEKDCRCAGLYAACDMQHVTRSRETRASIRRKLGILP